MASLALSGHFPPDRLLFLEVLTKCLAHRSRLRAHTEGTYPGADLVILYEWEGQRCGYRLPPEVFLKWTPHYAAYMVQRFLWKTALANLYASGERQGAERYAPTPLEHALQAGMHRRPSRRR